MASWERLRAFGFRVPAGQFVTKTALTAADTQHPVSRVAKCYSKAPVYKL